MLLKPVGPRVNVPLPAPILAAFQVEFISNDAFLALNGRGATTIKIFGDGYRDHIAAGGVKHIIDFASCGLAGSYVTPSQVSWSRSSHCPAQRRYLVNIV